MNNLDTESTTCKNIQTQKHTLFTIPEAKVPVTTNNNESKKLKIKQERGGMEVNKEAESQPTSAMQS